MSKYKILWLDDDFLPIVPFADERENERREAFQDDVKQVMMNYDVEIDGVSDFSQFADRIQNTGMYQAVISDLRGLDPDNVLNDTIFLNKVSKLVETIPNMEVFVYSSNTNMEKFENELYELNEKGHVFKKGNPIKYLFDKIIEVLDGNLHFYKGHEECLELFNKEWLNMVNRPPMDEILKKYKENDKEYAPYNKMRTILENILNSLVEKGVIKVEDNLDSFNGFNAKMKYLTDSYRNAVDYYGKTIFLPNGKPKKDYKKPCVPYEVCRIEVKYTLSFLCDITNRYSHFLENHPRYLQQGETILEYNLLLQQSTYQAFFLAMKWYHGFMKNELWKKMA